MDNPCSSGERLHRTLKQFACINMVLTRAHYLLRTHVAPCLSAGPGRPYHLVDIGAGGCDIPVRFLRWCAKRGLRLRVTAFDHDPRVVDFARRRHGDVPGFTIVCRDGMDIRDVGPVDGIFASHLLHHLSDTTMVKLLSDLPALRPQLILLNDIKRSRLAYLGYYVFSALFFRRSYAFEDGLTSVRRGFAEGELRALVRQAKPDGQGYEIQSLFPARLVILRKSR